MSEYIKSYSNYVIKKKHQLTDNGVIYERDITTIGGLDQFAPGQVPIYNSGNFIITINNDKTSVKETDKIDWENDGEFWSLSNLPAQNENKENQVTQINQDYFRLRDFAYYGSCTELIRSSIINIISTFPGELYAPMINNKGVNVYYQNKNNDNLVLGNQNLFLLDNPYSIDIYTAKIADNSSNTLKYFANNGFKNYVIINNNGEETEITTWNVNYINKCANKGEQICTVTLNDEWIIEVWKGNDNNILYLTDEQHLLLHVRPKEEFIKKFYNDLDFFEKILVNQYSKPLYSVNFEIIYENDYGYVTEIKTFTFPTTYGDYNLAANGAAYNAYLTQLQEIALFYDEFFSDNLYRMMTHESIKNFDWTKKNENDIEINEELIPKVLRIIGREFDEIKLYIDFLKNSYVIDKQYYNYLFNSNLTDLLNYYGWDIKNITPFKLVETIITVNGLQKVVTDASEDDEKNNSYQGKKLNRYFNIEEDLIVKPFQNINKKDDGTNINLFEYPYGYFYICDCENKKINKIAAQDKKYMFDECANQIRNRIKDYMSNQTYTSAEVYDFFQRMLLLNSKEIFRKKGTIEGIESIMGLFGLKSKRWINSLSKLQLEEIKKRNYSDINKLWDYDINEYTSFTNGIEDIWNEEKGMTQIDWYNSTKNIVYNNNSSINGYYEQYQGLPVISYPKLSDNTIIDINNVHSINNDLVTKNNIIYPYYDSNQELDGQIYYQMNGGWQQKYPFVFDKFNNIISFDEKYNDTHFFTETLKEIKMANDLPSLLSLPFNQLKNNDIFYVKKLTTNYIIIDGVIYPLLTDENNYEYFTIEVNSTSNITIGQTQFLNYVIVSNPYSSDEEMKIVFNQLKPSSKINIYVINGICKIYSEYNSVSSILYFKDEKILNNISESSHYFKLNNKKYHSYINENGWMQIDGTDKVQIGKIQKAINYFKGNNPHNSNYHYDNGSEYINYFTQLFKYSIENELFNTKCYSEFYDVYQEDMNNIKSIGFKNLNDFSKINDYQLINDKKIHYFGNILQKDNKIKYYTINEPKDDTEYNLTLLSPYKEYIANYDITNNNGIFNTKGYLINGVNHQILNTKRINLSFNIKTNIFYNSVTLSYIKYLDEVVLNYVNQLMPNSLIYSIQYKENNNRLLFYVVDTKGIFTPIANADVNNTELTIDEPSITVENTTLDIINK